MNPGSKAIKTEGHMCSYLSYRIPRWPLAQCIRRRPKEPGIRHLAPPRHFFSSLSSLGFFLGLSPPPGFWTCGGVVFCEGTFGIPFLLPIFLRGKALSLVAYGGYRGNMQAQMKKRLDLRASCSKKQTIGGL